MKYNLMYFFHLTFFIPLTDFISQQWQAANFSKRDSYPTQHNQKMILESKNLISFSELNRFLFIRGINDKLWD